MLSRVRWIILALLFLSTVINYIDRMALAVVLPNLRSDLGIGSAEYGAIMTLFLVAYTVAQLFAGVIIDRVGTRIGFAVAIVAWSAASIGHALAQGALSLGILRFLLGLSEAGNWPAGAKAIAEWIPKSRRAFAMGLFDGGSAVGAIVAPPLVAVLAIHMGWRMSFVITGVLGFFWLAAWLWFYRGPREHAWLNDAEREQVAADCGMADKKPAFGQAFRAIIGVRQLWGLMATRMLATPVWWFYVFWLPDYLSKSRGLSLKEIGMFGWIPFLTVDLGKMLGGAASDRLLARGVSATWARKSVMCCGALAMLGGIQVVGAETAAGAIAWVCLATFGFGMWSANILALHADLFPSQVMATAIGLTGMAASMGGALFTFVTGLVVDRAGYDPVFLAAGSAAVVACLALFFGVGKVEQRRIQWVAG